VWGIVTSITIKMYPAPIDGFTAMLVSWGGDLCDGDKRDLQVFLEYFSQWILSRGICSCACRLRWHACLPRLY